MDKETNGKTIEKVQRLIAIGITGTIKSMAAKGNQAMEAKLNPN